MFEPEHEFQTKDGHLICDQLITESNITKAQQRYLAQVFGNKVDCDWIGQLSNRKFKRHLWPFLPKMYVIKFVRGNLSATFLSSYFNIPTLFIVRNPYDVVFSQNRVKFPWLYNFDHFKKQKELGIILKKRNNFDWNELNTFTDIQKLTLRWVIENEVAIELHSKESSKFKFLKYETLKSDISLFYKLCEEFNLQPLENLEAIYIRPSSKTHSKSNFRKNNGTKLDEKTIEEINSILIRFDAKLYPKQ